MAYNKGLSIYVERSDGKTELKRQHIHRLRIVRDKPRLYECVMCGAELKRKSGILLDGMARQERMK